MPSFSGSAPDLVETGPVIEVLVGTSRAWTEALSQTTPPLLAPPPIRVQAMIDTGAGGTVVNRWVIEALNLQPVGTTSIVTPSTTSTPLTCETFTVDLTFPGAVTVPDKFVICAPLAFQNIQCLIGRDILKACVLVYVGHLNQFTLSI